MPTDIQKNEKMAYAYRVKISRHEVSDNDIWKINSYYRISDERGQWHCSVYNLSEITTSNNLIETIRKKCLINKPGLSWVKLSLRKMIGLKHYLVKTNEN